MQVVRSRILLGPLIYFLHLFLLASWLLKHHARILGLTSILLFLAVLDVVICHKGLLEGLRGASGSALDRNLVFIFHLNSILLHQLQVLLILLLVFNLGGNVLIAVVNAVDQPLLQLGLSLLVVIEVLMVDLLAQVDQLLAVQVPFVQVPKPPLVPQQQI